MSSMHSSRPLRVLQLGPDVSEAGSRGGIATVMELLLRDPDPAVSLTHVVTFSEVGRARKLWVGVRGMAQAARLIAGRKTDVVHAHMSFKGSVVRKGLLLRVAQLFGVPTILHCHSHGFSHWFDGLTWIERRGVRALLHADRWLVLGDRWATEYAERLRTRAVTVLRNPTAPLDVQASDVLENPWPDPTESAARFLFLGRLGQRKGSFDLIAALSALEPSDLARLRLIMAGDGDVEGVKAAAVAAGVAHRIEFPGWINAETRSRLLATADVVVLPSYQEGLPMAVLEGMAAGAAVLTSPVGGIPEVLTDRVDSLLVPPGDVPGLAAALTELIRSSELRRTLGGAALHKARTDLGIDAWYAQLARVWHETARRHHRA